MVPSLPSRRAIQGERRGAVQLYCSRNEVPRTLLNSPAHSFAHSTAHRAQPQVACFIHLNTRLAPREHVDILIPSNVLFSFFIKKYRGNFVFFSHHLFAISSYVQRR